LVTSFVHHTINSLTHAGIHLEHVTSLISDPIISPKIKLAEIAAEEGVAITL
jgi:hypothetical protein